MNDNIVFITGGASGLGQVLVKKFIEDGYKTCFTYLNSREKAEQLESEYGEKILAIHADASNFD